MADDFEGFRCREELLAMRETIELERQCRNVVFIDKLKHHLRDLAWSRCLGELGLDVVLGRESVDEELVEKATKCFLDAFELYDSFDDVMLSNECLRIAWAAGSKAQDAYWKCMHKLNQDNPP